MADTESRLLMLIDDEPAQSRLITALAAREGWRTLVVSDPETAIATLGTRQGMQLSAIILDQWVPGENACELIEELKAQGLGIFLIEHDIHNVMKLCDRASVMKNGQLVGTVNVRDVTDDDILGMIILGKKPSHLAA